MASIHPKDNDSGNQVLHACEPDYKEIISNANVRRRMSHIIKMGVACALECIYKVDDKQVDAIITATALGCLADTEKFLSNLIDNDEEMLNPTAFIQSTFNSIGAQIALLTNNKAYNNTYVHRGLSFESALIDAMMCLNEDSWQVLVGAVDEITDTSFIIQKRLGLLDNLKAGEGAQFFMLSTAKTNNTIASLIGVETFTGQLSVKDIELKTNDFLLKNRLNRTSIEFLMTGRNGNPIKDKIYKPIEELFINSDILHFKDECGEYPTASAYGLWKAANLLTEKDTGTLLIYNQYNNIDHSLILLRK